MKFLIAFIVFAAVLVSPALAIGNVTVNGTSLAPSYVNTRTVYSFLNLSFNATAEEINVTSLNITIKGIGVENITLVRLINETGSIIATNTTWNTTTNYTILSPSGGFNVTLWQNRSMIVEINISRNATRASTF